MELRYLGFPPRLTQLNLVVPKSAGIGEHMRKGKNRGFWGSVSGAFLFLEDASWPGLGRKGVKSDPDFLGSASPVLSVTVNVAPPEPANGRRGAPKAGPVKGRGGRLSLSGEE